MRDRAFASSAKDEQVRQLDDYCGRAKRRLHTDHQSRLTVFVQAVESSKGLSIIPSMMNEVIASDLIALPAPFSNQLQLGNNRRADVARFLQITFGFFKERRKRSMKKRVHVVFRKHASAENANLCPATTDH